ncbi:MAG: DUF1592 domain-containing protein [Nannocystales bacterium]
MQRRMNNHWILGAALLVAPGCYGGLDLEAAGAGPNSGPGGTDSGAESGSGSDTDSDSDSDSDGPNGAELPAPSSRLARLTHTQWENTVQDLLYLDTPTGFSESFRADPSNAGYLFDNSAAALEVDQALWSGYQRAAVDTAALAVTTPAVLAAILPVDGGDDAARAEAFVRDFGMRTFRRPLEEDEVIAYAALFPGAADLYDETTGFDAGVQLVIETMLQSAHFLYRIEASTEADGDVIALNDFEVAQRLSYFLLDSMPDDELFDVAVEGSLTQGDVLEDQARRLLADPRARQVVETFHDDLFDAESYLSASPLPAFYPDAPSDLGELAVQEFHTFVDRTLIDDQGGVYDLLTSNVTYVNDDLAAIYGVTGVTGDEFQRVELDPELRRGLFTQIGFLVGNATGVQPDPIHRGAFISERIACSELPPPPDDIPPLPDVAGLTNREAIEELTEEPGSNCAGCHSVFINPMGFPFENYDSTGAFRTQDDGKTVDPATTVILDGQENPVANAVELADLLAQSPSVHECYAKHWVEYASGRPALPEDEALVHRLAAASLDSSASMQDTLVEIVKSQPFTTRSAFELE